MNEQMRIMENGIRRLKLMELGVNGVTFSEFIDGATEKQKYVLQKNFEALLFEYSKKNNKVYHICTFLKFGNNTFKLASKDIVLIIQVYMATEIGGSYNIYSKIENKFNLFLFPISDMTTEKRRRIEWIEMVIEVVKKSQKKISNK